MHSRRNAEHHAGAPFDEIGQVEMAFALVGAEVAGGEQAAKTAIGGAIGRPGDDVGRAIAKYEAATDDVTEALFLSHDMAADHAGEQGATAVEGYAMVTQPGLEITWGEVHVGAVQVFDEAGFTEVSAPTKRRRVMRIDF